MLKKIVFVGLIVLGIFSLLLYQGGATRINRDRLAAILPADTLVIYVQDGCSHCHEAREFISKNVLPAYPGLKIEYRDAKKEKYRQELILLVRVHHLNPETVGTPIICGQGQVLIGWTKESGKKLINLIKKMTAKKS